MAAGRTVLQGDGLSFYVRNGDIQTGPLSLLAARLFALTPRNGFVLCVVVSATLGLVALRCLERSCTTADPASERRIATTTLLGGIIVMFWWAKLGGYGHLDDAIVLTAAAGSVLQVRRNRPMLAALLIGLAIAAKPWAVIFLPLALGSSGPLRRRLLPPMLAVAIGAVAWGPFVMFEPDTLRSLRPTVNIASDSVLNLFGFSNDLPGWLRGMQLLGALAVATIAMLRGRLGGVVLAAVAVRIATDPGTWSYYTAGFVLGALAWDLLETRRQMPIVTFGASLLLLPPWIIPSADVRAWLRLLACVCAVALVFFARPSRSRKLAQ